MKPVLVGIGELLWDMLPEGKHVGGAPANFAYFANCLGGRGYIVSRIGSDKLGNDLLCHLDTISLSSQYIDVDNEHLTGTASITLDGQGNARFNIHPDVAWDYILLTPALTSLSMKADVICFGTLAQRQRVSRDTIQYLLKQTPEKALRVLDVNLRPPYSSPAIIKNSLEMTNVVKMNNEELQVIAKLLHLSGNDVTLLRLLSQAYNLRLVALTKGEHGSILYSQGEVSECNSKSIDVVDTVGAGDAFTSAMVLGMINGLDLDAINSYASNVAAYVCSQNGATPMIPDELNIDNVLPNQQRISDTAKKGAKTSA